MALNLNKPRTLSAEEITKFENDNKSRGQVQTLRFPADAPGGEPLVFQVAKPGRQLLAAIADIGAGNSSKANEVLLNGCILAGDLAQLDEDDALYFGLLKEISELVEAKKKI